MGEKNGEGEHVGGALSKSPLDIDVRLGETDVTGGEGGLNLPEMEGQRVVP